MLFPCGMSRSGTTLLTTVLDSHSKISLGYELIPPVLPGPSILKQALEEGMKLSKGNFDKCGAVLRESGKKDIGLFITRCHRACISYDELSEILVELSARNIEGISSFRDRLDIAWRIARKKKLKEGTAVFGFKLNSPSVGEAFRLFPGGYFIYIIRDPRDVVASHIKRGFKRTISEICSAWNNYIKSFERFHAENLRISLIIRYEDLVSRPDDIIAQIFEKLPLELEQEVFRFYDSKASVHKGGHPNMENLQKDFFTTSIGRWKAELKREDLSLIKQLCKDKMKAYRYD